MGMLVWDGSVWICLTDRWVWVASVFFFSGGGWGGYVFARWRRWVWVCLVESDREKEIERNIYWNIYIYTFKWSGKKYRIFDVWFIVIWGVKINKVVFWDAKC